LLEQLKTARFVIRRMRERIVRCLTHSQNRKPRDSLPAAPEPVSQNHRSRTADRGAPRHPDCFARAAGARTAGFRPSDGRTVGL
jgi:hypothetical protein